MPIKVDKLPTKPLTDEGLRSLSPSGVTIHVLKNRPKVVIGTSSGEFEGDIILFWLEYDEHYRKYQYQADGWYAYKKATKPCPDTEGIIEDRYEPV